MTTPDTLNPYEQIWQSRDLKALESTPIKLNNKRPEWKKGLNAFVDEMQGTGYGLAALASQGVENVVGPNDITKGITDWGLEGYNRNMEESQAGVNAPKIARVEDVHTASDAMDWASFQLGKGLPMLASLAVPAAIGGTIARFGAKEGVAALAKSAVGDTVKKAVATKALQAAEGDVVTGAMKQAAAKALQDRIAAGAVTGGYLGSFGLEGGQSFGETVAQGVKPEDAVKSAIAVGGINGALEFLPFYSAAKSIGLGQYAKKGIMDIIKNDEGLSKMAVALATAKELGGRAVKGGIVGAGAEGITEGLQELTSIAGERWAKNDPLFADLSEDDWSRVKNSMAAGALVGGTAMGAGAMLKGPQKVGTSTDENQPTASSAGGASARPKTREQEIEELRNKINTELEAAIKSGNTARAEQLAGARDMIDKGVAPPVPVQDTPIQEPPAQEPIVQETPVQEVPTTEATPARPDEPIQLKRGEEIILTPPKPGEPETRVVPTEEEKVRLQELMGERPERAPITYDAAAQEVIPNAEEAQPPTETQVTNDTALPTDIIGKIRERMSNVEVGPLENGRKKISFDVDGKHVEGTVNTGNRDFISNKVTPQEGGDVKYSMPLNPNMEVSEASMEEFEAVRKQFQERQKQETPFKNWFGKGTKDITANADGTPITLYHGTNNPTFNQWDSSRAGKASAHPTSGLGFFMTADKGAAARYGNNLMALHAKIQNPYTLTDADLTSIETKEDATKLRKRLMAKGYDGAVVKAPGAKPYVIAFDSKQVKFVTNESPTDSPDFRYSIPESNVQDTQELVQEPSNTEQGTVQEEKPLSNEQMPVTRSVTPAEFRSNIDSIMGERWLQQAESAGIIQIVDGKGTRGEAGSWDGNTFKIYLQSMPVNGSPAGVLLHEGSHAPTFKQILGDNLEGFLSDLDKLATNGNKAAQKAITHATIASANVLGIKHSLDMGGSKEDFANVQALIEEQKPGLLAEEKLAYFIQYGSETQSGAGFLKRLINAIKAWFAQTQLGQALQAAGIGFELTEGMAVEWAKTSLQRSLENAQRTAQVKEQVVNEAKLMPPSVRLGRALAALDGQYSFADEAAIQNIPEASLNAVRASYENTDQWMKTPNGQDTKLNERQWLQVRTPEFKAWFGDWEGDPANASKMVDENGEPLVVYHGTNKTDNFSEFNIRSDGAAYFTSKREYANDMSKRKMVIDPITANDYVGQVIPVFLKLDNPAKLKSSVLEDLGYSKATIQKLKTLGHDGAISKDGQIAVFNSTQIKSAIGNTGEFSSTNPDIRYSMNIQGIIDAAWTDPTDSRVEMVNKPGLLQRWRADFIDFFAEIEKKSKTVYDAFTLLRNKKAARLAQARQEYYLPLLKEIVGSKWTAKQVGDMLAARHHKVDKVNTRLAERAGYGYTKELLKTLNKTKRKELMEGRVHIKAGKMPDGKVYTINGVPATMSAVTKQKLMFDLMNKYSQFEITDANGKQALREEWEIFKDAAGGFSDGGVAKDMVRTVDEVLAPASSDQARFDRIAALFDAMNRHALQIREDGGLITAAEHARLLIDKSAYAPLKRESYNVNSETARLFQQAGRGGNKNLGTRAGTAELSEPTNVLQNALALLEASAAAAERNLANQELYKVVNADKAAWKPWFHIAEKDEYVTHDEDGFLQEKNSTAVNRADIVLIKDGKKIVIRPNMHNDRAMGFVRAANNLDAQELSGPMKVLGMFNNLVRAVNITFSPIFLMMNAIKDPLTAAYNLQATEGAKHTKEIFVKDYFKTYRNSFRMLKKVFMDGNRDRTDADVKWVERYENAGGRTSFIEQLKENDNTWRSFDAQVARRQGNFKHLMAVKDTWIDGIENLNILFENVMRFSTFRVLVEKGMSDTDAARIAQDLTTNFSRRGYKSQALGLWWLFFNASVQGNYQVVRNLMKSKRLQVLSLGTIAFAVMLDLLGRAIADDWDEIPEWDKERFIIIPVKVDGDYVKIPAPWVYNTLWRTGGLIGEMFSGVKEPQDALLDMAAMTATTFNPLGKPGSIAQAIAPTAADPFIQILENKDFAGNPIGPEGYPGASKKANSELLWSSTPKGYQSIARFVNEVTGGSATESGGIDLKPGDYQLLAKFLTGSMGRFLTDSTFGFAEDVKKGIEGPKDIPVIREFFSDPYDPLTVQKYHTNIASIYGAHRLERMYREGPDRDLIKLQEVRSERGEELRMYSQAQDVERQLKSLRVRLKAAQARDDVGREKQLKERMAQVQEQFNAAYRQRVN